MGSLRVLFASTHSYFPQRKGGAESSTHELCVELSERGHAVGVLASLEPRGVLALINRFRRKILRAGLFPADHRMGYPVFRGWTPAEGVGEVAERFAPSVAVVQAGTPVPLVLAFLQRNVPTTLYVRDVEFHRLGGEIPRDPRLRLVANSRFTADRVRERLGLEAAVVPPLVRPEIYRTVTRREVVLYVNPHPVKGVEIALRLAAARPDIPFLFLEAWSLRPDRKRDLLARARKLPNVQWHDPVDDMRHMYGRARIVLMPSVWEEAWGRVATEAQVSGIPVLASDRGGLPESVGPGGILCDPDGPFHAWESALARLWDSKKAYQEFSGAALAHAHRPEIQPHRIADRLIKVLTEHVRAYS